MEKILESDIIENKTISQDILPNDLWEVVSAFANADGGTINLGVNPEGDTVGVDRNNHDKLQRDIISMCNSRFNNKIYPEINIDSAVNVISIYIPPTPAGLRPIYLKRKGCPKGARVRVGSANMQVDEVWMRRFSVAAQGGAELIPFNIDVKEVIDFDFFNEYLDQVKLKRGDVYKDIKQEEVLRKLRITQDNKVTLFGLLAFSKGIFLQEQTAPTLNLAVTHYAGTTKVEEDDLAAISLDDKEFSGCVSHQFEEALKFIKTKLPMRSRVGKEGKRKSYLAIPDIALRETLANALAHRDYTFYGGRVQIDIYSDRIEFSNPGRSIVPIEQLAQAHPQTRNPLLMSHLKDLNITEHRGRGITTIIRSLKAIGLSEPTFEHRHDWFVATLYSSAFIQDGDKLWLHQFTTLSLKESQLKALVYLKHNREGMKNSEYRELNDMNGVGDDTRAKKDLKKLVDLGLLHKSGEKRYTRYFLV